MMQQDTAEGTSSASTWLNYLPLILWQKRYYILGSLLLLLLISTVAAFALPTTYRSTATLLVQSQDLPSSVADAPAVGAIEQRIARIREQVLSRGDLIQLIDKDELYPDERRSKPLSKIIEKMRAATSVSALSSDIGQQSSSQQNNTIALTMSFDYSDPVKAQAVLQSFVSKFLSMDSEDVENQASLAERVLHDQADKLQSQISAIEGQITALKAKNGAALASTGAPPLIDTGSFSAQITSLQNENRQLITQSRHPAEKDTALGAAEAALAAAQSQYSDTHPDVIAAKQRVAQLRHMAQQGGGGDTAQEQIAANNAAIHQLMDQRDGMLARANASLAGQARAPAIEEQAMQLQNQASTLRNQYQGVLENLLKAQNGARMASEQRAEHLSLVDPANIPDHPYWPNRPLLIAAGGAAGLVLGLLIALGLELLNRPLRSPRQIEQLGLPMIGLVPLLKTKSKGRSGRLPAFLSREKRLAA